MARELTGGLLQRFVATASVVVALQDFAHRDFVLGASSLAIGIVLLMNQTISATQPGRRRRAC